MYYPFQFEISIRKAAEQLVRLPPKTLPKPQLQHPFSVVKLRHVDQTHAETKPQPQTESADPPAPPTSCQSAIHFMSRILHRLREVDEHVSEVNSISSFVCFFLFSLSSFQTTVIVASSDPPEGPRMNADYILCPDYTFRLV